MSSVIFFAIIIALFGNPLLGVLMVVIAILFLAVRRAYRAICVICDEVLKL